MQGTSANELISLWQMFDDVVSYTEDPSGTTAGIAAISSKFNNEWRAYEVGRKTIGQATKGHLKVYASRCVKDSQDALPLQRCQTRRWRAVGRADYELRHGMEGPQGAGFRLNRQSRPLRGPLRKTCSRVAQVRKAGKNYVFNPIGGGVDVKELFEKARTEAEGNEVKQRQAWEAPLGFGEVGNPHVADADGPGL